MKTFFSIYFSLSFYCLFSQNTTILPGGGNYNNNSSNQSLSIPILTYSQIKVFPNPSNGMMIYDSDSKCIRVFDGSEWNCLSSDNNNGLVGCGSCFANKLGDSFGYNGIDSEADISGVYLVFTEIISTPILPGGLIMSSKLLKLDNNGNLIWQNYIITTTADPQLKTIKIITTSNSIYVIASFCGRINFPNFLGDVDPMGGSDSIIFRFDKNGNRKWVKLLGGINQDIPRGITTDLNENIYVVGYFDSPTLTAGNFTLNNTSINKKDVFITKLDSTGNFLDLKKIGGILDDDVASIQHNPNSQNMMIIGNFEGSSTFNNINLTSNGKKDMFIGKMDYFMNVSNVSQFGGNTVNDEIYPVDFSFSSDFQRVLICGNFIGTNTISNISCLNGSGFVFEGLYSSPNIPKSSSVLINSNFNYFKKGYALINNTDDFSIQRKLIRYNSRNSNLVKFDSNSNFTWVKSSGTDRSNAVCLAQRNAETFIFGKVLGLSNFCNTTILATNFTNPFPPNNIIEKYNLFHWKYLE